MFSCQEMCNVVTKFHFQMRIEQIELSKQKIDSWNIMPQHCRVRNNRTSGIADYRPVRDIFYSNVTATVYVNNVVY